MSATTDNIMNRVIDWVNNRLRVDATLSQSANIIGKVGIDQTTPGTTNATSDAGFAKTITHYRQNNSDYTTARDISDAPTSGQKLGLVDLLIWNNSAVDVAVSIKEETSGTVVHGPYKLASKQGFQLTVRGTPTSKLATANKKYQASADVAGELTVETWTYSEA